MSIRLHVVGMVDGAVVCAMLYVQLSSRVSSKALAGLFGA